MTPQSSDVMIDDQPCHIDIGGMYNIYNALAAFAVGRAFGVTPTEISQAFAYDEKVFGRQEVIQLGKKKLTLILVKNPVGLNQVLSMIETAKQPFGFAMLLKVMLKPKYMPYLVLGFVIASMIPFSNVLPVALIGGVFAAIEYFRTRENMALKAQIKDLSVRSQGGGMDDGI